MQIYALPSDANNFEDFIPTNADLLRIMHVHWLLKRGSGRVRPGPSQQGGSDKARGRDNHPTVYQFASSPAPSERRKSMTGGAAVGRCLRGASGIHTACAAASEG